MHVAEQFQGGGGQPFGFINDQQLDPAGCVAGAGIGDFTDGSLMIVNADAEADDPMVDVADQLAISGQLCKLPRTCTSPLQTSSDIHKVSSILRSTAALVVVVAES
ncbi:MAG TPA: hypothetical protein PLF56_10845, partial [Micropruina sp.]|nr:hypothetical protein [Micropruina sp.]